MPLLQEELELEEPEETPPQPYAPDWEPGDQLFLTPSDGYNLLASHRGSQA